MLALFTEYVDFIDQSSKKRKRESELCPRVGVPQDQGQASNSEDYSNRRTSANILCSEFADGKNPVLEDAHSRNLGVRLPTDRWIGCTRLRTLQALLKTIDERGFERSNQQLQFHAAFIAACARVIYREEYAVSFSSINKHNHWPNDSKEVLISTPRRFGKTFSVAIFCASISLCSQQEVVIFSPARRASRAILIRVYEFICLLGYAELVVEYNQEVLRLRNLEGGYSKIRSFPSKKAVRSHAPTPRTRTLCPGRAHAHARTRTHTHARYAPTGRRLRAARRRPSCTGGE